MDLGGRCSAAVLPGKVLINEPLGPNVIDDFLTMSDEEGSYLGEEVVVAEVVGVDCSTAEFAQN